MAVIRRCPTKNCTTQPVAGFSYCREHAGSERGQYDALERVERKLEASRRQLRGAVDV